LDKREAFDRMKGKIRINEGSAFNLAKKPILYIKTFVTIWAFKIRLYLKNH